MIDTEFFSLSLNVIYSLHNGEIFTQSLIIYASQDQHDNYDILITTKNTKELIPIQHSYSTLAVPTAKVFHIRAIYTRKNKTRLK